MPVAYSLTSMTGTYTIFHLNLKITGLSLHFDHP